MRAFGPISWLLVLVSSAWAEEGPKRPLVRVRSGDAGAPVSVAIVLPDRPADGPRQAYAGGEPLFGGRDRDVLLWAEVTNLEPRTFYVDSRVYGNPFMFELRQTWRDIEVTQNVVRINYALHPGFEDRRNTVRLDPGAAVRLPLSLASAFGCQTERPCPHKELEYGHWLDGPYALSARIGVYALDEEDRPSHVAFVRSPEFRFRARRVQLYYENNQLPPLPPPEPEPEKPLSLVERRFMEWERFDFLPKEIRQFLYNNQRFPVSLRELYEKSEESVREDWAYSRTRRPEGPREWEEDILYREIPGYDGPADNTVIAWDRPGNWPDGGIVAFYKNRTPRFINAEPEVYRELSEALMTRTRKAFVAELIPGADVESFED